MINEFKKNEIYYLFVIFAKENTEQRYQIYVGHDPDFDPCSIRMVQADIGPNPVGFTRLGRCRPGAPGGSTRRTGSSRSRSRLADLPDLGGEDRGRQGEEVPAQDVLHVEHGKTCNDCEFDRATGQCQDSGESHVCRWATADLDCPDGGCFGIAFTLPDLFATFDSPPNPDPRPAAVCLRRPPRGTCRSTPGRWMTGCARRLRDKRPNDFCQVK